MYNHDPRFQLTYIYVKLLQKDLGILFSFENQKCYNLLVVRCANLCLLEARQRGQ